MFKSVNISIKISKISFYHSKVFLAFIPTWKKFQVHFKNRHLITGFIYWSCVASMCFAKSLPPGLFLLPQLHPSLSNGKSQPSMRQPSGRYDIAWWKSLNSIIIGTNQIPHESQLYHTSLGQSTTTHLQVTLALKYHCVPIWNITVYLFPIPQRGDFLCPGTTKMEGTDRAALRELIDRGEKRDPDTYQCKKRSSVLNMQFLRWLAEIFGAKDGTTKI